MLTTKNSQILLNGKPQESCSLEELVADAIDHLCKCEVRPGDDGECLIDHIYDALIAAREKGEPCERGH